MTADLVKKFISIAYFSQKRKNKKKIKLIKKYINEIR